MARSSLLLAVIMSTTGCLITSTPEFEDPEQTAPTLLQPTAFPDSRSVVVIRADSEPVEFSAEFVSEDAGEEVIPYLYIGYGIPNSNNEVAQRVIRNATKIPPSTLDDPESRRAVARWNPGLDSVDPGCHTVTLIVSHGFDEGSGCPLSLADSTQLTWRVVLCSELDTDCPNPDPNSELWCPGPNPVPQEELVSCPEEGAGFIPGGSP